MADYRYLLFPALHSKFRDGVVLSLLAKGKRSLAAIAELTSTKLQKVEELSAQLKKGQEVAREEA